jgi:pyruvate formate lyase activating enzyme
VKINLGGLIPISTVDWYGKVAFVIFLRGCPLNCIYCQNHHLLEGEDYVPLEYVESEIAKSMDFIDGVVFSGGEPFSQFSALKKLAGFTHASDLLVGIETNGFYPDRIKEMLEDDLVDKIFLDVKAPLSEEGLYEKICMQEDVVERVRRSIVVCNNRINLEIRTTVFRDLVGKDEVTRIAEEIGDINCTYVIQQGLPEYAPDEEIRRIKPFDREEIMGIANTLNLKSETRIRTKEFGDENISRHG